MKRLRLRRTERLADGTFGQLEIEGHQTLLVTAEDDWSDNARGVSCIPPGLYELRRTIYHRYGYDTYEVWAVPSRSRILIHPGNTEEDTQGCILVGSAMGWLTVAEDEDTGERDARKRAILQSREGFKAFMAAMESVPWALLRITEDFG